MSMNSGSLTTSSEVLQVLFQNSKSVLAEQFMRWKLWKQWEEFAGPTIAGVSEPVSYRKGTLYVWVKNASWMQQMIFMLEPLRDSINKKLNTPFVKVIYLTMDRKSVPFEEQSKKELLHAMEKLLTQGDKS